MRKLVVTIGIVVALLGLVACGGSSLPQSSLTIRNAATNALISASNAQGTITLNVGNTLQIRVNRTYTNSQGQTITDEVTQFTNFVWESGAGAATIDQLGNITGVALGIAVLQAKFRATSLDPWDICRVTVQVI